MSAITQADREAFAARWGFTVDDRDGSDPCLIMLARHRLQARTKALEEAAKVAERLQRLTPYDFNSWPCQVTMERIATAIRALNTQEDAP